MKFYRSYSELITFPSFDERFDYLSLTGVVGERTFGGNRYLNQNFYRSREWKQIRDQIITRDNGCDLGLDGYQIGGQIIIHHINPITELTMKSLDEIILNPENLITVSVMTHKALHYGDKSLIISDPIVRKPNDTCLWKEIR